MSAFGVEADIANSSGHVPLMTHKRHRRLAQAECLAIAKIASTPARAGFRIAAKVFFISLRLDDRLAQAYYQFEGEAASSNGGKDG